MHREKIIYEYLCERPSETHGEQAILSQLCGNSNDWQCIKIHSGTENNMQSLQSQVEEANLRLPMHVLHYIRAGYKTYVVVSNDTDVIVALLVHLTISRGSSGTVGKSREKQHYSFCPSSHFACKIGPLHVDTTSSTTQPHGV